MKKYLGKLVSFTIEPVMPATGNGAYGQEAEGFKDGIETVEMSDTFQEYLDERDSMLQGGDITVPIDITEQDVKEGCQLEEVIYFGASYMR